MDSAALSPMLLDTVVRLALKCVDCNLFSI